MEKSETYSVSEYKADPYKSRLTFRYWGLLSKLNFIEHLSLREGSACVR